MSEHSMRTLLRSVEWTTHFIFKYYECIERLKIALFATHKHVFEQEFAN